VFVPNGKVLLDSAQDAHIETAPPRELPLHCLEEAKNILKTTGAHLL
jgi:hypothetical protein